jgi:hypothetical protein
VTGTAYGATIEHLREKNKGGRCSLANSDKIGVYLLDVCILRGSQQEILSLPKTCRDAARMLGLLLTFSKPKPMKRLTTRPTNYQHLGISYGY